MQKTIILAPPNSEAQGSEIQGSETQGSANTRKVAIAEPYNRRLTPAELAQAAKDELEQWKQQAESDEQQEARTQQLVRRAEASLLINSQELRESLTQTIHQLPSQITQAAATIGTFFRKIKGRLPSKTPKATNAIEIQMGGLGDGNDNNKRQHIKFLHLLAIAKSRNKTSTPALNRCLNSPYLASTSFYRTAILDSNLNSAQPHLHSTHPQATSSSSTASTKAQATGPNQGTANLTKHAPPEQALQGNLTPPHEDVTEAIIDGETANTPASYPVNLSTAHHFVQQKHTAPPGKPMVAATNIFISSRQYVRAAEKEFRQQMQCFYKKQAPKYQK